MLRRNDILSLEYIKKTAFSGSFEGIRFRLKKKESDEGVVLEACAWPEPYCFDKTGEDKKAYRDFSFDVDGVRQAVEWLNGQRPAR